jgi:hypothetical protein
MSTASASVALQRELWALVEFAAIPQPSTAPATALSEIQRRARVLLTARDNLSASGADDALGDGSSDNGRQTTTEDEEKTYEAVNEEIARQMIDGVEPLGSATAAETEDKSDTLSDCTTLTETSSVYGIHNTWVDLAVLYALPFVFDAADSAGAGSRQSSRRLKPVPELNIAQEQSHLNKIFHESQRAIHTMRSVATVDSLRKVLDRGVTVLHFSGHGGRLAGKKNFLVFEDTQSAGLAHLVDASVLRSILNGGGAGSSVSGQFDGAIPIRLGDASGGDDDDQDTTFSDDAPPASSPSITSTESSETRSGLNSTLKLVFVSSCDSKEIGEVFIQAGVSHVVCVRCETKILDEASSLFSYSFYHAVLSGKSVQQAFEIARVRVNAEMHIPDDESDKFVLLESSLLHSTECPHLSNLRDATPRAIEVSFYEKNCSCNVQTSHSVFADISVGKWVDVSPTNRFGKTLPSVSESFVGRELELHVLAELVNHHRFVTVRGPPGIGKSTLSIRLAHFLEERNVFPDGVAFIRFRGVQSLEGMESAIKSTLFPDGAKDKETPLHQVLADLNVLLVMDNMEDPINASPSAVREFILNMLQNTSGVSFLMTARQAMGGGISDFDEKVVSLNRLSSYHAADLFLKKSPRPLLVSEIDDGSTDYATGRVPITDALMNHPLMAFLDGHPQAISLCAPLLQDRSLGELTRAVLSRGVSELQVVGLPAHDRSAVNTLVTSLSVSLEQVRMHHGPDAIRFFALLGLLPAGAMAVDFKSLWGSKWEVLVETLLRFSLIQRNRIPGFISANRGLPKKGGVTGTTNGVGGATRKRISARRSRQRGAGDGFDQPLLLALKAYADYITGKVPAAGGKSDPHLDLDLPTGRGESSDGFSERSMLNTLTRSGRTSRVAVHVERMDNQAEVMAVSVSYSTFPFITSYARSLLGMYDGDGAKNDALEGLCVPDRDAFVYNCVKHFWKVSFWIFQHICTLAVKSSAAYLILDIHETNMWMILDLHIRMIEEWRAEADAAVSSSPSTTGAHINGAASSPTMAHSEMNGKATPLSLQKKLGSYVADVACLFAHSLFLSGRHRGAWNAANKSLRIAKYHKNTLNEANTRKLMGILLTTETKFDEAKAQFGMSLILYKAVGDKIGQAASLSAIGMIHSRKGNLRGAHNCFTKALTLYEWFKHSLGQLNCHQRLANLEKKLRDGDGLPRPHGVSAGHSHHYAATRRLQGDLNRKRNGEYIVRWVGHEMSLLLELPPSSVVKIHEAHTPLMASAVPHLTLSLSDSPDTGASPPPATSVIMNTPRKSRFDNTSSLGTNTTVTTSSAAVVSGSAPSTCASPLSAASGSEPIGDRLKKSSFARRKEYDSSIRRIAGASGTVSAGSETTSDADA